MTNCEEIIIAKLKELGADGLCSDECSCSIDDLFLCGENCSVCEPAKRTVRDDEEIFIPLESCETEKEDIE